MSKLEQLKAKKEALETEFFSGKIRGEALTKLKHQIQEVSHAIAIEQYYSESFTGQCAKKG